MGFSPPILHCYCSCSSSMLWISDPVRQPWLLLRLAGRGNDVVVRDFIPLVVVYLLICVLGLGWHRFTITKFLVALFTALLRRRFVASGGTVWTAVARVSVVGWVSYWAYALVIIVLRINFLILAPLEPRRELIFLVSFLSVWACPTDWLCVSIFSPLD
ncbi:hypothetical protein RchiOBHm_Chr4g0431321 [Rosa chinensis]|uniref:Uncharacterized protein n=1 Tax=Rosa chinensis TaxID=74649 RepID=A0A2P6R0N6_ROSCH|nr:hypothetical protein RchiOBHm_Chr4g0431321 [Rosa chinensis]